MQRQIKYTFKEFFFGRDFNVFSTGKGKKPILKMRKVISEIFMFIKITPLCETGIQDSRLEFNVPMNEKYCFVLQRGTRK